MCVSMANRTIIIILFNLIDNIKENNYNMYDYV